MPNTVQIRGVQAVLAALRKEGLKRAKSTGTVTVGFTQRYALVVHETNRKYNQGKAGTKKRQWKYLETPTRQLSNSGELAAQIRTVAKKTGSITMGLKIAGLRLLREAQDVVPRDTSALRASGFVGVGNAIPESQAAFSKSETLRKKKRKKK